MIEKTTQLKDYLNFRSPLCCNRDTMTRIAIYEFVFVFLLLMVVRPSFMDDLSIFSLFQVALTTAFLFSFSAWLYFVTTNKYIDTKKWRYRDDILRFYKMLFTVGFIFLGYVFTIVKYLYSTEITMPIDFLLFVSLLGYIFFIGTLAYIFLKLLGYVTGLNNKRIRKKNEVLNDLDNETDTIILYGKNKDEYIKTTVDDFLYLESIGHYVKVYLKSKDSKPQVKIIRNSLNNIIKNIKQYNDVFQCHRSYVINLNKIERIEGNYKKSFLKLDLIDSKIPISRPNYTKLRTVRNFSSKFNRTYAIAE